MVRIKIRIRIKNRSRSRSRSRIRSRIRISVKKRYLQRYVLLLYVCKRSHFHAERENTSMAKPLGTNSNCPPTFLNNLLDDCESKSDALMIHFSSSMQFTEATKQLWDVFSLNSCSSVFHMNDQKPRLGIVVSFNINGASSRKLSCILNDVE